MAFTESPNAWKVLAVDVSLGFGAWASHRLI